MTYEPLHHKYRPQTFADLVGQQAIAATLANAIRQNRIAPAYLFTGPRGTGKTSSARILAKSLNCLVEDHPTVSPCGKCQMCQGIVTGNSLDVIEIDAASNTGVDQIRELIERSQFAPVQGRYKIYVLDEVHMLSTAAFNALLKTLEEPPNQVVFVLATTDPQRVLPTIISRCQRFDFRRIPLGDMIAHLQKIAQLETIQISPEALTLVAQIAQGGLRDAESLLDQLSLIEDEVTPEQVWDLVGTVPERDLMGLLEAIANHHPIHLLERCRTILDRGREPLIVLQNLTSCYRDLLIAKTAPERQDLVALTTLGWQQLLKLTPQFEISTILASQQHLRTCELQIKNTTQPRLWLEVALLGLLPNHLNAPSPQPPIPSIEATPAASQPPVQPLQRSHQPSVPSAPFQASEPPQPPPVVPQQPEPHSEVPPQPAAVPPANLDELWQQALSQIKSHATQAILRQHGRLLDYQDGIVKIGISTKPLLKTAQGREPLIAEGFQAILHIPVKIMLVVATRDRHDSSKAASPVTFTPPEPIAAPSPPPERRETPPPRSEVDSVPVSAPAPVPITPNVHPVEQAALASAAKSFAEFFKGELIETIDIEETPEDLSEPEREIPKTLELSPSELDSALESPSEKDDDEENLPF